MSVPVIYWQQRKLLILLCNSVFPLFFSFSMKFLKCLFPSFFFFIAMLPASVHSYFHLLFNQCRTGCGKNTESENIDSKTPNQKKSTQKHRIKNHQNWTNGEITPNQKHRIKNTESITQNHRHRSWSNVNKLPNKAQQIKLIVEKIPKNHYNQNII